MTEPLTFPLPKMCIFCGAPPTDKNKEHILPQWLLELTGDPKRTFGLGIDFRTKKPRSFAADQFVMPACSDCNGEFGKLEDRVKPIVMRLLKGELLEVSDYNHLLDWLDKVRIGLWLAFIILDKNPGGVEPQFHIASRVGQKDRMLAVYPMDSDNVGLSIFGVESLSFSYRPCAFGLYINNTYILNASSDFMISARSGFPFPKDVKMDLDLQMISADKLEAFGFYKSPLLRFPLYKPSVLLFQPVIQLANWHEHIDGSAAKFVEDHLLPSSESKGALFRQWKDDVAVLTSDQPIEFDSIDFSEGRPLYEMHAQVFELQNFLMEQSPSPYSKSPDRIKMFRTYFKEARKWNLEKAKFLRTNGKDGKLKRPGGR